MNLIPDDCIQCEIALGGKLRDSQFVNAIKEKSTKDSMSFSYALASYMNAWHRWGHKG